MNSKTCETLQASRGWRKISYSKIREKGRGLMSQRRPLREFQRLSPTIRFHVSVRKSADTCIMSICTKKPLGAISETEQEVGQFDF